MAAGQPSLWPWFIRTRRGLKNPAPPVMTLSRMTWAHPWLSANVNPRWQLFWRRTCSITKLSRWSREALATEATGASWTLSCRPSSHARLSTTWWVPIFTLLYRRKIVCWSSKSLNQTTLNKMLIFYANSVLKLAAIFKLKCRVFLDWGWNVLFCANFKGIKLVMEPNSFVFQAALFQSGVITQQYFLWDWLELFRAKYTIFACFFDKT